MRAVLRVAAAAVAATATRNAAGANGLKRMYALDCGRFVAKDQSRWTPGVNAPAALAATIARAPKFYE